MVAVEKLHEVGQGLGGVRVEGDEAAAWVALQDAEGGLGTDADGLADEGVFPERPGPEPCLDIEIEVGAETAGVEWLAELLGQVLDGLEGDEGDGAAIGLRGGGLGEGEGVGVGEEGGEVVEEGWVFGGVGGAGGGLDGDFA